MPNSASRSNASDESVRPDEDAENPQPPWMVIAIFLLTAILVVALVAWSRSSALLLSVELLVAAASLSVGGFLGFLFGIPRGRVKDEEQSDNESSIDYRPSNNLEQISDWLTKILIGVGLVELKQVNEILRSIGYAVENFLAQGALTGTRVITQAVLVIFVVLGFYLSFLWTRLYYGPLQMLTDNEVIRRLRSRVVTLKNVANQFAKGKIATAAMKSGPKDEKAALTTGVKPPSDWRPEVLQKIQKFTESERDWDSDPTRDIFGDRPQEDNGRRLEPKVKVNLGSSLVIDLTVRRVSRRSKSLVDEVAFLLHPTFNQPVLYATADGDSATVKISPLGSFTVVAIMDKGETILAYDLSKLPNVPQWFND